MRRDASRLPVARPMNEFLVERFETEVLVYDQVGHRAHCLTTGAALVWAYCDGTAGSMDKAVAALAEAGEVASVESILPQLEQAGLLTSTARTVRRDGVNQSRRRMLGKTAIAAGVILASPVVYSIISPSVAEAASTSACGAKTQPCCTTTPVCNTGLRCSSSKICQ